MIYSYGIRVAICKAENMMAVCSVRATARNLLLTAFLLSSRRAVVWGKKIMICGCGWRWIRVLCTNVLLMKSNNYFYALFLSLSLSLFYKQQSASNFNINDNRQFCCCSNGNVFCFGLALAQMKNRFVDWKWKTDWLRRHCPLNAQAIAHGRRGFGWRAGGVHTANRDLILFFGPTKRTHGPNSKNHLEYHHQYRVE